MKENRLIAEFMGLKEHEGSYYLPLYNSGDWIPDVELEYHTDWNWLMPVVSKCRCDSDSEDSHWEEIYYTLEECNLNTTYKAVVEFIKQFNK